MRSCFGTRLPTARLWVGFVDVSTLLGAGCAQYQLLEQEKANLQTEFDHAVGECRIITTEQNYSESVSTAPLAGTREGKTRCARVDGRGKVPCG